MRETNGEWNERRFISTRGENLHMSHDSDKSPNPFDKGLGEGEEIIRNHLEMRNRNSRKRHEATEFLIADETSFVRFASDSVRSAASDLGSGKGKS